MIAIITAGTLATYYIFNSVVLSFIAGILFFVGYLVIYKSTNKRSNKFNEARAKIRKAGYDSTKEPRQNQPKSGGTSKDESILPPEVLKALKVLSLDPHSTFTTRDIKKAFHTQVRLHHPDLTKGNASADATDKIVNLNSSKTTCLNYLQEFNHD